MKQDSKHVNGSRTHANPDKYDDDTNATKEGRFGRKLELNNRMSSESETDELQLMFTAKPILSPRVKHEIEGLRLS